MEILKNMEVPTGNILIVKGERGDIEMVSLGDYGKEVNLKADFLGLNREIKKVKHGKLLPLEEKWVITVSTQYGCLSDCKFCDVPKIQYKGNISFSDIVWQVCYNLVFSIF